MTIEWPAWADVESRNPTYIENFLSSEIKNNQVTLIGELDLVEPTEYGGASWSLLQLANYLVSKDIIKRTLSSNPYGYWPFPATLAIWAVGHAQTAEDGNKLWEVDGYSTSQKSRLAETFAESIKLLGLNTFSEVLQGAQKYVQLARIHAMIPDFTLDRYSQIIAAGVKFNRPKKQIFNEILKDSIIAKGVPRLFESEPNLGIDLIERSFNYLAYGYELDLPSRIKDKLGSGPNKKVINRTKIQFPKIIFVEWERRIEIHGADSWRIISKTGLRIDPQSIPAEPLFADNGSGESIKFFDPSAGYLVFDIDGNILDGREISKEGGFIAWRDDLQVFTEIENLETGYLNDWPDWKYAFYQGIESLEVKAKDGRIFNLSKQKSFDIIEYEIQHLFDKHKNKLYSEYPHITTPQNFKLTDHILGTQQRFEGKVGPILNGNGGNIDITVSTGLGRSKNFTGLVVPGIQVKGLESALVLGEKRKVTISLPAGWKFVYPEEYKGRGECVFEIQGKTDLQPEIIRIENDSKEQHIVGVEAPLLSWSLEFENKENEMHATEVIKARDDRRKIRALILHEVNDYVPFLKVNDSSISGRKRGRDVRYDLRRLQDDRSSEETLVSITWNYIQLPLVTFKDIKTKSMRLKDMNELPSALELVGIWSPGAWEDYQASKKQESLQLRNRIRGMRRKI